MTPIDPLALAVFNAIEYATSMKVDFFPAEPTAFARRQLDRRAFPTDSDATWSAFSRSDAGVT